MPTDNDAPADERCESCDRLDPANCPCPPDAEPWPTAVLHGDEAAELIETIGFDPAPYLILVAVSAEEEAALVTELVLRYRALKEN